jgi:hypothetical protein
MYWYEEWRVINQGHVCACPREQLALCALQMSIIGIIRRSATA